MPQKGSQLEISLFQSFIDQAAQTDKGEPDKEFKQKSYMALLIEAWTCIVGVVGWLESVSTVKKASMSFIGSRLIAVIRVVKHHVSCIYSSSRSCADS